MKDRLKIAFLDTIGLPYTGDTLTKRGLGGSESAVIYLTKELVELGFQVDVYNRCEKEGSFNNVNYYNLEKAIDININYDILISSRSCLPFAPDPMRDTIIKDWRFDIFSTKNLVQHSKYKVVWLHDTFCQGDGYLEDFARAELFNEIFTLSDWHSDYTLNGHQWRYRYYEVLKRKIWQTRNGIHSYIDEVDIKKKNPNQFVYTSAVTKGLIPLLENIWEKVYNEIPNAKLKVVGGYYAGAGANGKPDAQELKWRELKEKYDGKFGIEFTGLVTQQKVAEIVAESSLMIYPALFPETFGMSVLEAINYNTPVITCRFGALEEVAVEKCCYLTDYEASNPKFNVKEFISRAVMAHKDAYLRQQKAYACNELKPWIGWNSVAMQWKEHFYKKLGLYLNISEIKKVRKINYNVNSVFNMRFINEESNYMPILEDIERHILIISPFYNSEAYLEKCIKSVASQLYNNYTMILIDDVSTDNSNNVVEKTIKSLSKELQDKFVFMENNENVGAIQNQVNNIIAFIEERDDNSIIALLDGDDALTNNPDIFNLLNHEYATGAKFTYGSMHSIVDNINLIAQPYSQKTKKEKIFKEEIFNWGMPYTHLRTFSADIFKKIDLDLLKDENGNFYRAGGDGSLFYALLDQCEPHEIRCIQKIIYEYNDKNPINDYKVNSEEQTKTGSRIMNDRRYGHGTTIKKNEGDLKIVEKDLQLKNNLPESNLMDNLQHIYQDILRREDDKIALYKHIIENRTDVWLEDPNNPSFATRFNWILSQLDALEVKITSKILDIGSWTGTLANYLNIIGYKDITCIDISKNAVKMGTEVYPNLKWYQGDIEKLNLFESYDIIILGNVLQHLINPYETLNKIKEHLNFKGKILFTVPTETYINPNGVSYEHVSTLNFGELKPICEDLIELQDQNITWYAGRITKESMEKGIPINNIEPIKTSSDKKRVLIAMPTAKYIESETFMSIYKLKKPENLQVDFQCFYGYNVAQVRNLIANYAILGKYDWVFWVDSDIILPEDSLIKFLSTCDQGADFVTGIYRQRKEEKIIPEIYVWNDKGGMDNALPENIPFNQIIEIAGCGLGCAITSVKLIETIGYPQFEYHNAIKKEDTLSEDIDFCLKAIQKKFHIYADTSIKCLHIGNTYFRL